MKILFISGNLTNGGAQRVISVVSSSLAKCGHDVSVLLYSRSEKEYPLDDKVRLYSLADSSEEYSKISSLKRIKKIRKYLRNIKPDVAVGFLEGGYGLYLSSFGLKIKTVSSVRIDPEYIFKKNKSFRSFINRRWFYSSDATVLQTESQLSRIPKKIRKKAVVIPNPVSDVALTCNDFNANETCRKFIMVGRLDGQKNYLMALKVFEKITAEYPDVTLDIFGKGREENNLKNYIKEHKLENNVFLRGWTQNTVGEYALHDAFLMTSDFEGMPNALAEAMAVGLPCISTDCLTGPSDLIDDGVNGFLVPVGDENSLYNAVKTLIDMPKSSRKETSGFAKKKMAECFNSKTVTEEWEKLFNQLIK